MVEIKTNKGYRCDDCGNASDEVTQIIFRQDIIFLCDNCLQELNRKIVEHLADKNI